MSGLQTLRDIVAEYQSEYQQHSEDKLEFFRVQRNLADAISSASLAQGPGGKRLAHQRRIPAAVLEEARMRLLEVMNRLKTAGTFAELHQIVGDELRDIRGIGKLTIYDTALRIASWRRVEPEQVFLHGNCRRRESARVLWRWRSSLDGGLTLKS